MVKCVISAYFKFVVRFRSVVAFCLKSTNVLCTIDIGFDSLQETGEFLCGF